MKGTVKNFNKEKGYGFIRAEDNRDYFFHYSALIMDDYKTAEKGENVEFEIRFGRVLFYLRKVYARAKANRNGASHPSAFS